MTSSQRPTGLPSAPAAPPSSPTTSGTDTTNGNLGDAAAGAVDSMTERLPDSISDKAEPVAETVKDSAAELGQKADDVKNHLGDAVSAGKDGAGEVLGTATDKAQEVAGEALRQARDLIGEARTQVSQQAGEQHRKAAESLRSLSDQLGAMVQGADQEGMAVELVSQARDRVRTTADWLEQREPGELVNELRAFARRRPGTFLLGAAAAGVLAGRLTRGVAAAHSTTASSAPAPATPALPMASATPAAQGGLAGAASDPATYPTQVIGYSSPPNSGVGYQPTSEREPDPYGYSGTTGRSGAAGGIAP